MLERIKTAIILVVLVLFCLFATSSPVLILLLLGAGAVIAAFEWSKFLPDNKQPHVMILSVLSASIISYFIHDFMVISWILSFAIWLFAFYWVIQYPHKTSWFNKPTLMYIGIVLIVATLSAMFYLWQQSPWWLLYAMSLGWLADTGAYFVGKNFGKRKLASVVSPKKTIEGLLGGLAICVIVIAVIAVYVLKLQNQQLLTFVVLSTSVAGISVLGDLFESMLKRKIGIKDSGNILPGHGGVLDRIDSMLATLPLFAFAYMNLGITW